MAIKSLHITNSWHAASGGISTFYRQLLAAANRHRRPLRLIVPGGRTYIEEVGEYGRIYVVEGVRAPLNAGYRLVIAR